MGLGEKFAINHSLCEIPYLRLISDIESSLRHVDNEECRSSLRSDIASSIKHYVIKGEHLEYKDKFIKNLVDKTKDFITDYKNTANSKEITIGRTDKSKQTVILYKSEYKNAMLNLLNDTENYKQRKRDPTNRINKLNNKYVRKLFSAEIINKSKKYQLTGSNANAPRIYGLIKSHKEGVGRGNIKLRPVVSFIGSPLYNLSKFLGDILTMSLNSQFLIKNSYEFCAFIREQRIPEGYTLISFDVVSLFTCLPQEFLIECIKSRWKDIEKFASMSLELFLEGVGLCLNNSYLIYEGNFYLQLSGTPMGAPISSPIALLAMEVIFEKILNIMPFDIPFLKYFVDDSFTAIPSHLVEETLEIFNSVHPKIQFTYELEKEGKLPFLDLLIIRGENGSIHTDFYQKPLSSNRILNYNSAHSLSLKINTATGLVKRVFNFSSTRNDSEKKNLIFSILQDNNYPKVLINRIINEFKHRQTHPTSSNEANRIPSSSIVQIKNLTIPIIRRIEQNNNNNKIGISLTNTVKKLFSAVKDPIPMTRKSNLIYRIKCKNCPSEYIGMTSRQTLHRRITQHKNDQKNAIAKRIAKTALCDHVVEKGHHFDLDNTKILETNNNYCKLKTLEMLRILQSENSCNKRTDVDHTVAQYQSLIRFLRQKNLLSSK